MQNVVPIPNSLLTKVSDLVDDYLMACRARGLSPGTLTTSYGYPLRHVLLPYCAERGIGSIDQLTSREMDGLSIDLSTRLGKTGKPLSKFTIHSYLRAVRGFLNWCAREGEQVAGRPSLPRLPRRVIDVLSRQEISQLEATATSDRDALIVRILGDCGLRASELCHLRVSDLVRHDRQTFLLVQGKGERERLVPVQPSLVRRIEQFIRNTRPRGTDRVEIFLSLRRGRSGDYEPLTRYGLAQLVGNVAVRANLEHRHVHPHLFRHSFITNALRAGVSPILLSQIVGHTSLRMIEQVYSHLNASDGYDALTRALAVPVGG